MSTGWTLATNVTANTAGFEKGMGRVAKKTTAAQKAAKALKVGLSLAGAALGAVTAIMKKSLDAYAAQEQAEAQLTAALKSTGHAAGLTADEIKKFAAQRQGVTMFGDEATIAASSVLLSFTNIREGAFKPTMIAVQDLAARMGTDLQSATVQLGKALNDPVANLSALSKAGIQFSKEQKKMIFALVETGDMLGAQKLILGELSTQFGGSAAAAAGTYAGKMAILSNSFSDLGEKLGEKLAPELILIIRFLQEAIDTAQRLGILHVGAKKEVEPEMRKARLQDMTEEDLEQWEELDKVQKRNLQHLKTARRKTTEGWQRGVVGERKLQERIQLDKQIKSKERAIEFNALKRERIRKEIADPEHQARIDKKAEAQRKRNEEIQREADEKSAGKRDVQRGVIADQQEKIEQLEARQAELQKAIDATFASPEERREDRKRQIELNGMIKQQNEILKQQQTELDKLRAA